MKTAKVYNKKVAVGFAAAAFFLLASCQKDQIETTYDFFGDETPVHFPEKVYNNPENPLTEQGFELGRKLFYDPILSADSTISCGSCHAQVHGFADHNNRFSTGVDGRMGVRNSPALSNLAWYPSFMADGGINHLEVMPFAPITDVNEMAEDLANVVKKLNRNPQYQTQFKTVFGVNEIQSQELFYALAQIMQSMISATSKYDKYLLGTGSLNEKELKGLELFKVNCSACHQGPLTTDFSFANNGIDSIYADGGRGKITQLAADSGSFRVPNLRNIALTYPYMHDGRFYTLNAVLDHYASGVIQNGKLDARLPGNIALSEDDKEAIITFLTTLTDYEYLENRRLAEPIQ